MDITRESTFEQGWSNIQKDVTKLIRIIEGPEPQLTPADYIYAYTTVYNMCNQKSDYKKQLRDKFPQVIEDYIKQKVLPSLKEKHGENMLRELVKRWNNHKVIVQWLCWIFAYVERYSHVSHKRGELKEVGFTLFHDLVYPEMQSNASKAVIALINKELEGEQIDRALVKDVLDVYVENGMGTMENFEDEFESFMFQNASSYYRDHVIQSRNSFVNHVRREREELKRLSD